jgi:predicted DNA-binding ribbon-helix-helix protein
MGRPKRQGEKMVAVSTTLPKTLYDYLKEKAGRRDVSVANLIRNSAAKTQRRGNEHIRKDA